MTTKHVYYLSITQTRIIKGILLFHISLTKFLTSKWLIRKKNSFSENQKTRLLTGYYGGQNFGDEAILDSLLHILDEEHPDDAVIVSSVDPSHTTSNYDVKHAIPTFRESPLTWLKTMAEVDELYIGGGGLIEEKNILKYSLIIFLASIFCVKVSLVSVGVGPKFSNPLNQYLLRHSLSLVDCICVRDENSKQLVRDVGYYGEVHVVADPAFIDPGNHKTEHNSVTFENSLTVIVRSVRWKSIDIEEFAAALDAVSKEIECKILLVVSRKSPSRDRELAEELHEYISHKSILINHSQEYEEISSIIRASDLVIGMPLHSNILAARYSTAFVGLAYNPKCVNILSQVGQTDVMWFDEIDRTKLINQILDRWKNNQLLSEVDRKVETLASDSYGVVHIINQQTRSINLLSLCAVVVALPIALVRHLVDSV